MNSDDALYLLGLESIADAVAVRDAYARRRLEYEQRLSAAATEGLKQKYHATLSDLDEAYSLLLGATHPPADEVRSANASTGGTILRADQTARRSQGLAVGQVLANRYEMRRVLGQGGMGAVYEAFDRLKQENVAIKVLLPQYLGSEHGRSRFMHEAKVACRLAHPNIVKVFDVGLEEPYHFITMELLEGETLRDQMERRKADRERYNVPEVLGYVKQLIGALEYAHRQIVHRDLKPENVWVCADGSLKLIDFGIARAFTQSALTRTGMVMGTAYYMAPEQFNGAKDVGWQADQYSLAVIAYEMLAGRVPQGSFASTSELRRDVPLALSRALLTALAPEPASRFSSLNEFGIALERRDAMRGKSTAMWLAASALVAVTVGAIWLVAPRSDKHTPTQTAEVPVTQTTAAPPLVEVTPSAPPPAASTAGVAEEQEAIALFGMLQQRERELAEAVRTQQQRYEGLVRNAESADGAARRTAEAQAADAARELQTRLDIHAENAARVFSPQAWSAATSQIESAQSQLRAGDAAAARVQFAAARDTLRARATLSGDIEKFMRARANYLDAKQQWALFSAMHTGGPPDNPAIPRAEAGLQAAVDRGEYARLALEVFPKLTAQYLIALRDARRGLEAQTPGEDNNAEPDTSDDTAERESGTAAAVADLPRQQQAIADRTLAQAERRRQAFLLECERSRRPSPDCPKPAK